MLQVKSCTPTWVREWVTAAEWSGNEAPHSLHSPSSVK